MPRIKQSKDEERDNHVRRILRGIQAYHGWDDERMGAKMGVTGRTFRNRLRNPKALSLKELRGVSEVIKEEDKLLIF